MGGQVLVVEDDPDIGEVVTEVLRDEGYEVTLVPNGKAALDALEELRPCVVFLDLMMPVMDGWELLSKLAARNVLATLPVVVTSAAPVHSLDGPRQVIRKPYDLEHVVRLARRFCQPDAGASQQAGERSR